MKIFFGTYSDKFSYVQKISPPQDLTLLGKRTALVPLPEMKTTLGGGRLGLTHDGFAVALKLRLLTLGKCRHILLYLLIGDFAVNLCRVDTTMPQHLTHRLNRQAVFQTDGCGKSMPCGVRTRLCMGRTSSLDE
ncbi:hypothetical protein SAMN02745171_00065 [Porphyromonas circumdentaria]|uniref:Uncharacterized protein n=1 Tax=Porphyromonas circumdentaria TaxID=29524 RepID=A0A1T4KIY7_9PORP|nr:hypothetical protein [Porphyromonas circumdentaria]SJZ42370.1 hypothetical protein SAMN02745171_00065 [Porphyromonas circumdentaria]